MSHFDEEHVNGCSVLYAEVMCLTYALGYNSGKVREKCYGRVCMKKGKLTPFEMRVLQLMYRYETDIECNGIIFSRKSDGAELLPFIRADEESLYAPGVEEAFSEGYYVIVSEESLQVTEAQLKEVLAGFERKKLVKKFDISQYNGEEINLMRQEGGTFQSYTEVPRGIYAYMLSRLAYDTFDFRKEEIG